MGGRPADRATAGGEPREAELADMAEREARREILVGRNEIGRGQQVRIDPVPGFGLARAPQRLGAETLHLLCLVTRRTVT